jgi:hypothetical protein
LLLVEDIRYQSTPPEAEVENDLNLHVGWEAFVRPVW